MSGDDVNLPGQPGIDEEKTKKKHKKAEAGDAERNSPEHARSPSAMSSSSSSKSEKAKPPTWKSYLFLIVVLVVYISLNMLGGYIFQVIERKPTAGEPHWFPEYKEKFVREHNSSLTMEDLETFLEKLVEALDEDLSEITGNNSVHIDHWTFGSAFLLSFTIASTIGYGLVTPVTPGGQAFCILFALISIPLTGLLAAKIGSLMAYFIKKGVAVIFKKRKNNHKVKVASILFTFFVGVLIYIIIPTLILTFVSNEEEWTFLESLYCVFISLTTIGFGDYVPDPHSSAGMWANIFVLIWVVAGLAWFATIVNLIATAMTKQASSIQRKVAHQQINMKGLKSAKATISGHLSGKNRSKSSLYSAESGKKVGSSSSRPISLEYDEPEKGVGNGVEQVDQTDSKGSGSPLVKRETPNNVSEENFGPSVTPQPPLDSRRESGISRSSKRDDEVMLGPSGFLAVVMNNMEDYGDGTNPQEEEEDT